MIYGNMCFVSKVLDSLLQLYVINVIITTGLYQTGPIRIDYDSCLSTSRVAKLLTN